MDRFINLAGQTPIALASDGHDLIFIGTDVDILSKKIGGELRLKSFSVLKTGRSQAIKYYIRLVP